MSKSKKCILTVSLFTALMFPALSLANQAETSEKNNNRITVRGQVEMNYIIPEQDILIPVKYTRNGYISLDLNDVDKDKVQIHTEPAAGMRLDFKGDTENEKLPQWRRVSGVGTSNELGADGRFELEIDLDDEIKSIYMVLRCRGIRSKSLVQKEKVFRVFGFHELDLEANEKIYEVDIYFQAILPSKFKGVVKNIAEREGINASVRYTASFEETGFSSDTAPCEDDGTFEMLIPPLERAEVEAQVRGLSWIEFKRETLSTNRIQLREIMEKGLVVEVQERSTPSVVLDLEFIDRKGNSLNLEEIERQNFFIGFLRDDVEFTDNTAFSLTGTLWRSAGRGKIYYWNLEPGEKHLLARYMMEQRKITPSIIEVKDLDEEDHPQVINVQIVHEP